MLKERTSRQVSFYLSDELMNEARVVSQDYGIPLSRLVFDGLKREIQRWNALKLLTKDAN